MTFGKRIAGFAGIALVAACAGGCQSTPKNEHNAIVDYRTGNFPAAEEKLRAPAEKKDENYVLNNYRLGSAAIAAGDLPTAETAFYRAYQVVNSGDTNDPGRSLSATVLWEGVKVFKGEPFERAMAHYYLGLVYLIKHDYNNARAAFQNSNFQVREYTKKDDLKDYKAVESRFALGYFGLGFCYLRTGRTDLAQQNFQLALNCDPQLAQLIQDVQQPGVNTLIFVDSGGGPQKSPKGWYNEESVFGPTPAERGPVPQIMATVDGQPITSQHNYCTVDTLALAQERSWQDIDTVRKVKAAIGTGAMAAGTGLAAYGASSGKDEYIWGGLGAMAVGAALAASSQADLRYWEVLPRAVYVIPATLAPGTHEVHVQAGPFSSAPLQLQVSAPPPGTFDDHILYFRIGASPQGGRR
jgi:tetratricopeptide (TPR) repeat protein